ncbi:MAG: NAD(P)H-hydrate dehydratase, partial [Candidatus Levyibacteriota bacterium]
MNTYDKNDLKNLYVPSATSHKGQNGKLLLIGGSKLFHAASLWALSIASKIVDMVFYSSVPENNELVQKAKEEFRNGIVVPRGKIDQYIEEADAILIGPGLPREAGIEKGDDDTKVLTEHLLATYSKKKWVIDGGSLQVISPDKLPKNCIVTPHHQEFKTLFGIEGNEQTASDMAKKYSCIIVLKGEKDIVCSPEKCVQVIGGNAGMTKGGTGDVLAGLIAALACKNDMFLAATAGSFLNKKAGESLAKKVGTYFNASDLVGEIPV